MPGVILIALGESIVVIGTTLSRLHWISGAEIGAFAAALIGSVGLWWLYFDRSADESAKVIAASADPGRLGRSAYHFIHPVMVAGIIVIAAGDEVMLSRPGTVGDAAVSWMILGGTAAFIAGHAAFKATIWRRISWPRVAAIALLALLGLPAPHVSALILGGCAAAVVVAVAIADQFTNAAPDGARADAQAR